MSHIVKIKTQIKDAAAVAAACRRLNLVEPVQETVRLFSAEATGLAVRLPGWRHPVVCELSSGEVKFDNYQERWGKQAQLDAFLQSYTIEKARIEARRRGHSVSEQQLANGSVKLTIQVAGGAA